MGDSYGDGWTGGYLEVYVNGSSQGTFTVPSGGSQAIDSVLVTTGDLIQVYHTSGTYPSEESFIVYNNGLKILYSDGPNPSTGLVYSGTVTCVVNCNIAGTVQFTNETSSGSNGTATANVTGNGPLTYYWSNGASTQTITGLSAGTYNVTVSDDSCGGTGSVTVGAYICNLNVSVSTNPSGGNNGTATATATGTAPYTYIWSNGETSQTIINLAPGTYTVTAMDANGCTGSTSGIVSPGSGCNVTVYTTKTDESVAGANDGSATVYMTGGTAPYTDVWSNGATGQTITGLAPGTYFVTSTDANGCVGTSSAIINPGSSANSCYYYIEMIDDYGDGWNGASMTVYVNTVLVGSYTLVNGYYGIDSVSVSNGDIVQLVYSSGSYPSEESYRILDPNGAIILSDGPSPTNGTVFNGPVFCSSNPCATGITVTGTNETATNANDGTATASMTGGISPYSYSWSNGGNSSSISSLSPGTYTVTITDGAGCVETGSYTVLAFGCNTTLSISQTPLTGLGFDDGSITAAMSGTAPYTYTWSNGASTQTIQNLAPGTYSVTVTDANNCTETGQSTIQPYTCSISLSVVGTDETSQGANDGTATAQASGGSGTYYYIWSSGQTTSSISNLAPGNYTVTVTGSDSCVATGSVSVTGFGCNFTINVTAVNESSPGANDGSATVVANGTSPYSYVWSNGQTTSSIGSLGTGSYGVTVTDAAACVATGTAVITSCNLTTAFSSTDETGSNYSDGTATVTVLGGISPYTYAWANGSVSDTRSNLAPGWYVVTVYDAGNCQKVDSVLINPYVCALVSSMSYVPPTDSVTADGSASVVVTGGVSPYVYQWSNGATSSTITGLAGGTTLTVTITDGKGCIVTDGVYIGPSGCTMSVSSFQATDASGPGMNDGAIDATVVNGSGPYTYIWSNGNTTTGTAILSESNLGAGAYSITVLDDDGCGDFFSFYINDFPNSIEEENINSDEVSVYPNPTSSIVNLVWENESLERTLNIFDFNGRLVQNSIVRGNMTSFSVEDWAKGMYLVQITSSNSTSFKKLIVQ
jgi:hypothetical protein